MIERCLEVPKTTIINKEEAQKEQMLIVKNNYEMGILLAPSPEQQKESDQQIESLKIDDQNDFPILCMVNYFRNDNINLVLNEQKHDTVAQENAITLQQMSSGEIKEKASVAVLQQPNNLEFQEIQNDEIKRKQLEYQFRLAIAKSLQINIEDVLIVGCQKGSIRFIFMVKSDGVWTHIDDQKSIFQKDVLEQQLKTDVQMTSKLLFQYCQLSMDILDQEGDQEFGNYPIYFQRGPTKYGQQFTYYQPSNCQRYGLKVQGIYPPNDNWLRYDRNDEEWVVAFLVLGQNSFATILNQGGVDGLAQDKYRIGGTNKYQQEECILTQEQIGRTRQCLSPHCEVVQKSALQPQYDQSFMVGKKQFLLIFQCRIKPSEIRIPKKQSDLEQKQGIQGWDNDYWFVDQKFIRPYGLIIKQVLQ